MPLQGPVLAAIDLTDTADDVLAQASAMAKGLQARLVVCHVMHEMLHLRSLFPHPAGVDRTAAAGFEQRTREAVDARVRAVTHRTAGDVEVVIETGSTHAGILRRAEELGAGLIVVGPGSVAEHVTRYAPCAVLVARASAGGAVLAATDFSDPSWPAITMAAAESARRGVPLRVLHSIEAAGSIVLGSVAIGVLPGLPQQLVKDLEASARARIGAALTQMGATGEAVITHGPAARAIVDAAQAEPTVLIVIGRRGRSNLARLLLGSQAETILRTAPCSVLVVHLAQ